MKAVGGRVGELVQRVDHLPLLRLGGVRTDRLGSLERDLLKDTLAVVKRFKALVRHQFQLEAA